MKRKLNTIQIIPRAGCHSGGTLQAYQLAKGLYERGHDSLLIIRPGKQSIKKAEEFGIPYEAIPMKNEFDLKSVFKLRAIIKKFKPDVIHAHKGLALSLSLAALVGNRKTVLVANRGVMFPLDIFNSIKYRLSRLDGVVAVSNVVREIMIKSSGIQADKVRVIYGGTDLERFDYRISPTKIRNEFNVRDSYPLVGIIANIRRWKGHIYFVEAAKKVVEKFPKALFFIVGRYNEERETFKQLNRRIDELGIGDKLIFTGFREDVPEIISAMDITVNASYDGEGLTGTIRESFAMKTPVVATKIAGNPELVIDGKTGILVPPKDSSALAEGIIKIADNCELLREMGENAYQLILEKFSLESRIKAIEEFYYELLEKRQAI
ncbi:MAG: glycosyltransferase family 1 protein [Candidatus Schekmanbacteria bacterium]|nr:MAG: glycosyltransferase family 1 protein [Candidatus Schekmanbacteria bacterium]